MANATATKPKAKADRSKRPHAQPVTPAYAKRHATGIAHVARAAGVTPEVFVAMSTSRRHGIFDVREQRPVTAKVFASVPERDWPDTREVFCFAVGRREPLANGLRAAGMAARK